MNTTLTIRDIVDKVTGETLQSNVESREAARAYQRQLKKQGYTPRIIREDYQLVKTTFER